jgi:hypothetical protein
MTIVMVTAMKIVMAMQTLTDYSVAMVPRMQVILVVVKVKEEALTLLAARVSTTRRGVTTSTALVPPAARQCG